MKSTIGGLVIIVLTSATQIACEEKVKTTQVVRPVKILTLDEATAQGVRVFPGTVRAAQRAQLSFRVTGPLVKLPIFAGRSVKKGELLAQIDPRDFETAVSNLESRLADLNAQYKAMESARPEDIRRLEAVLAASQSKLLEATASFRRYQRLYENDNISKAEYDQSRAARDVAAAEVRSAEESLAVARSGARPEDLEAMAARVRAMESELRLAGDQLSDTELRAPYDGIVAERFVDNYEFVAAFKPILSLQDINTVEIVAQIPESIAARAKTGESATFKARFPSAPGVELEAVPTEFAAEADPVTRTYAVTFQARQPSEVNIFAGMTAEIEIAGTDASVAGFVVPGSAVFADADGQNKVWVLDSGAATPRKVPVQLGEPSGEGILVLSGLEPGNTIITAGAQFIAEGQQVRPISDELRERQ